MTFLGRVLSRCSVLRSGHGDSGLDREMVALGVHGPDGRQCHVDVAIWVGDLPYADWVCSDGCCCDGHIRAANSLW
jgi:hypothetical protein